jgi:DNA replication and repair protein RecF
MIIKNIKIHNFRNIELCNIEFNEKINIIIGDNAQGKTNILESIYYSTFYKSFRTSENKNLINIKADKFDIELDLLKNKIRNNLKVSLDKSSNKNIFLNNKKPDSIALYNTLNSIIYYPAEINLLLLYPSYRRNLIDRSIFFIENSYINIIKKYNKIIKQRNIFLKNYVNEYDPWLDQLIYISAEIIKKRIDYLEIINNKLYELYKNSQLEEKYNIKYKKYNKVNILEELNSHFKNVKDKEKKYGHTLFGPHVEDYIFYVNDRDIRKFSSEGQKKYFLLHFKYAQLLDYIDKFDDYPVILYDDFGSELDSKRTKNYFDKLYEKSGQIFITSTKNISDLYSDCKVMSINNGNISD